MARVMAFWAVFAHIISVIFVHLPSPLVCVGCNVKAVLFGIIPALNAQRNFNFLKGVQNIVPYHKNKQKAFQASEQGVMEAKKMFESIDKDSPDYGRQLKQLQQEINEAFAQIENAMENASEKQRRRLERYREELHSIAEEANLP